MSDAVCPSTVQTAAGLSTTSGIATGFSFSAREKETLRALAGRVGEIAARPEQAAKAALWTRHNDLEPSRPVVFCDPENGWNEIILQKDLECTDPLARVWEMSLRKEIFWGERMGDDRVVEPCFNVPFHYEDTHWGLQEKRIGGDRGGSYTWDVPLRDYDADFAKLRFPEIRVDEEQSERSLALAHELFDGELTVRRHTAWWWTLGMTWEYVTLRGLDNFMVDFYDNPEWVHKTMAFFRDGTLAKLEYLDGNGLLSSNVGDIYVGSGGFGWTRQLPRGGDAPTPAHPAGMWGFAESQETVGVSPDMFEEFVLPYQLPILERFGLNCYGCCEPLDARWRAVKRIPRLRRVSVSAWADREMMAECLGGGYIYSWKPSPTPLSRPTLDRDAVRRAIRETLDIAARGGCHVEIIMKDNHTLGGNPDNAVEWCRIAREEAAR
ncbi:MAG: hypothetical protein LBJ46_09835 [Planctomycetota bacterium]|jgi:hypothetical protein|nr:hypothetical protein [Planctomycetota bacterium]